MPSTTRKRRNPRKRAASSRYQPDLSSNAPKKSASAKPTPKKPANKPDGPIVYPMNLAGPLRRLYAFIIDLGLIFMVIYTVAPVAGGAMFSKEAAAPDLLFFFGYFVIPTTIWGRTPGKWVAGIVVVDSDGRTPGPAAIPREMIGKFVSYIAGTIGIVWLVFDPKRQGWHDKIAGTYVVDNPYSGGPKFLRDFFNLGAKSNSDDPANDEVPGKKADQKPDQNFDQEIESDSSDDDLQRNPVKQNPTSEKSRKP